MTQKRRFHLAAAETPQAQAALKALAELHGNHPVEEADVIVALGGDGFMLDTLHKYLESRLPVYGMNLGTVGFLLNRHETQGLQDRVQAADQTVLHPLRMRSWDAEGNEKETLLAVNDVSLLRQSPQTAHLRVLVDGVERLERLIGDGVLVATPAGSTAYNASLAGPIIPLGVGVVALTPISCARPRRWPGAILPDSVTVRIEILDSLKRPVSATADNRMLTGVSVVEVSTASDIGLCLLFDPGHALEERIVREQFVV